jgi:Fe-S cluster assembly scaffold protein SufB
VVAEFNRKFAKTQQQLDTVLQWIASQAVTPQAPRQPVAQDKPLSDEDLYALAQQGDQAAYAEWTRRQARQVYQQESAQANKARLVQGQLAALMGKYPVLNNSQHPLT